MVNEINNNSTNSLLNAALSNGISANGVSEVSSDNSKAAKNAESSQVFELIDDSVISTKAKRLNEAYKFGKLAQAIELPRNERFAALKAAVAQNGIGSVANNYNPEQLAKSMVNSSAGSFLR